MPAKISFDEDVRAVISVSGAEVTRDSMSDSIRRIIYELAANNCERLIVDMSASEIAAPVESTTIILDRLLNALHSSLTVALVFNEDQRPHFEHVSNYLEAGMVEVEGFATLHQARNWLSSGTGESRRA